jgi:hypothetical protein
VIDKQIDTFSGDIFSFIIVTGKEMGLERRGEEVLVGSLGPDSRVVLGWVKASSGTGVS